ncbi:zinc ABC transporter substrate-binding protein [Cellulomonas composti]|uniref:Zinc ABC transporter substrate-binding protein n=2 Tax=Cellulomonas composti TaxID=266130 RepID=A0A511J9Q6_9CELL|nr:zinc ABC transporter substrate-binding protein [Cellulomonas composti]
MADVRTLLAGIVAALLPLTLAACTSSQDAADDGPLEVVAAIYPLQYVAEQVGGDRVHVVGLVAPGTQPHDAPLDAELTAKLDDADVVLFLSGFQPAVDTAVTSSDTSSDTGADGPVLVDAASHTGDVAIAHDHHAMLPPAPPSAEPSADPSPSPSTPGPPADPHFWLDLSRMPSFAQHVAEQFTELDPSGSLTYERNAQNLTAQLADLDVRYASGLLSCERREVVSSHDAFGYLATRYNLHTAGILGTDPTTPPSTPDAAAARELAAGATTVFTEPLVDPRGADELAAEVGATTAVLDPIENVSGDDDFVSVAERNLTTLRTALGCS